MNFNHTTKQNLPVDVTPTTDSVVPTAATAYKRGDLLIVAADTNAATHSLTGKDWHVVCLADITADEADAKIAAGVEMPVYTAGKFDVAQTKINGVALDATQALAARAYAATSLPITLSVVK